MLGLPPNALLDTSFVNQPLVPTGSAMTCNDQRWKTRFPKTQDAKPPPHIGGGVPQMPSRKSKMQPSAHQGHHLQP